MKFGLEENIIEKIIQVLQTQPKVDKAYIFGSRAKGNYRPDSDIDIAIKGYDLTVEDILKMSAALDNSGIGHEMDLVDYFNIKENALMDHIDRVGMEFYTKWKKYKLGVLVDIINGYAFKSSDFTETMVSDSLPVIKIKNVANGDVNLSDCQYHPFDKSLTRFLVTRNDILVALTGNHPEVETQVVGAASRYKHEQSALLNQRVAKILPKEKIDQDYLYYFLNSEDTHEYLASQSAGSANQANISKSDIENIPILLPTIIEQGNIASALSSLDNKIDLLHRQNKTLESMAAALFRQWFIEERSEEFSLLGDYAYNVKEHVKVRNLNTFEQYVGLEHIQKKAFALTNWGNAEELESDKLVFKENDILFGKLRSYFHKVVFAPIDGVCSTDILVIRPKKKEWFSFCLLWFFSKELVDYSDLASEGTRMPRTNWEILANYQIPKPSPQKIEDFEKVINSQIKKIKSNISQIHSLEDLRDTLIPKLLSGEARVKMQ